MSWHPSDRLFLRLAGDQPATGEPLAQDLPHACSYCGSTEFEAPVDTGRGATATCRQCGGSMSSWGGQWTPELIGDPSNHPSPKVDPRSGAGFGQNYLVHPEGFDMMPPKEAFSVFEVTAGERPTVVHDPAEPIEEGARHTAMPRKTYGDVRGIAGSHIWRGVHAPGHYNDQSDEKRAAHARAAAEATRQGIPGDGMYGSGHYVNPAPGLAIAYAQAHSADNTGVVLHGQIAPDANVGHVNWAPHHVESRDVAEWGRQQGHDVLAMPGASHLVLNPKAVRWDPKNYSTTEAYHNFDEFGDHYEKPKGLFEATLHFTADGPEQDYRMQHQAPDSDYGAPLHDVEQMMPDFYTHPHYYNHGQEHFHESASVIHGARGNPEKKVRIYRALPAEHAGKGFNPGDWVSTSKSYARQHAKVTPDSKHDWPVISTTVPAKHLHTEGDVHEWAYNGPQKSHALVSFKGGHHQEVRQREDGTITPVQRRQNKENPLKGFDIQHHESDANTEDHKHHVFAYDPEGNYAGRLHANHGEEPYDTHVEPQHADTPLMERMRGKLPHLGQRNAPSTNVLGPQMCQARGVSQTTAEADWCAHRHMGSCYWPGDHPAPGQIPQRRGACNWTTAFAQQACPMSDPGPMAGMFIKGARESALLPVEESGFKGFVEPYEGHFQQSDTMDRRTRARQHERYEGAPEDHHYPAEQPKPAGSHMNLVDFVHDHRSNRELWHQHGQVEDVDLGHGVYATQPYLVREHLQRYHDDPQSMGTTQRANNGTQADWLKSYPGTHMPMFVRHQGSTFAIEGHHRVGAAFKRGEDQIRGMVYDADKHGWQSSHEDNSDYRNLQRYGSSADVHCTHEHDNADMVRAHELYNHDDGVCAATGLSEGLGTEASLQDPEVRLQFTATWADVRDKAKRIRSEGGVRILMASSEGVVGEVRGEHNVYETSLTYVPGSAKVGYWHCGCAWAAYAWGRSPKYRRFEGRMCSHALAMQFEAQSRSAYGREVMPDTQRPDWMKQRTPVVIQHQRDPKIDLTRRAVPPGNMRKVFSMWEAPADDDSSGLMSTEVDGHLQYIAAPDQDFHNTVQRALDHVRDDDAEKHADDATYAENYEPLKNSDVPEDHHGGWTFHRNVEGAPPVANMFADLFGPQKEHQHHPPVPVTEYKHPVNREPLHLDEHGNSYRRHYEWTSPDARVPEFKGWSGPHSAAETLREHPTWSQSFDEQGQRQHHMRTHEERLQRTGTDPTDSHHDVVMRRNRALGEAGWGVVSSLWPVDGAAVGLAGSRVDRHRQVTAASVCPECHGPVAPLATSCPHCGASLTPSDTPDFHLGAQQSYYHGTTVSDLNRVLPSNDHGKDILYPHMADPGYAYATTDPREAWNYAKTRYHNSTTGVPRVYEVRPRGEVESDPHFPGDLSHRSRAGWDVAGELPMPDHMHRDDWPEERQSYPWMEHQSAKKPGLPTVAGIVLKALDTGRILMLQRGMEDKKDPAAGLWEAPGGHLEPGDLTTLHAAIREWTEEVGQPFPEGGYVAASWIAPNGIYQGFCVVIPEERALVMHEGRIVPNPDDPKGDLAEQAAWWTVEHARKNPALRTELKSGTPWREIDRAGEGIKVAQLCGTQGHRLTLGPGHLAGDNTSLDWWPRTAEDARARIERLRQERDERNRVHKDRAESQRSARDDVFSRFFSPMSEEEIAARKPPTPKPEPIDHHTYSLNDVSKHYGWEGFDEHEISHLVHQPASAQFSHENVPVHSLRVTNEHGGLDKPHSYHDIVGEEDEDEEGGERERMHNLEHGYESGARIPPIVVVRHGEHHIIADGSHRAAIAMNNGDSHIPAFVTERTKFPKTADHSSNGPLKEFAPYPAADPPPHSMSQNPASTGFATSEDPDDWAEPHSTREDLRVSAQHHIAAEGYNAWRDRLWSDLREKGQPVPQTNHLYRAVSDGEMHAARQRGAFHSQDGQGLFVTDDPDRIGRKGGGYSGDGPGGHIIEIDRDKVNVGERPSYYNKRLAETTVDHVPMHAVTRSWSWNDEAKDHLPTDAHRTATLHNEPEPALPSTDGEREEPLPPGTPAPCTDAETLPHGYDDLTEFTEDHPEIAQTGSVAEIVAQFQRTAGAQALASSTPKEKDGMDIATAARMHLEGAQGGIGQPKTALKSFSFPEQQQLIHEGGDVTARNLDELQIGGTHYEPLEAALKEQEGNGIDAGDLFV